jgi:hypothetical protein
LIYQVNDKIFESGKRKRGKAQGVSCIETRSAPALTHLLPRIRPVGFPIYVAPPGGSIHSVAAATFTFYLGNPFLDSCVPVRRRTD